MAAPTVTGAVALYKESRPNATPAEVREALRYLGNLDWATSTDPDPYHEPLLDVSRIGTRSGPSTSARPATQPRTVEAGTTASIPFTLTRSATFFERVRLSITSLPDGWTGGAVPSSLMGWTRERGSPARSTIPAGTPLGHYEIGVQGTNQGRTATSDHRRRGRRGRSDGRATDAPRSQLGVDDDAQRGLGPRRLAGRDRPVERASPATRCSPAATAAPWSAVDRAGRRRRRTRSCWSVSTRAVRFRLRAVDAAGHWSPWVAGDRLAFALARRRRPELRHRSVGGLGAGVRAGRVPDDARRARSSAGASLTMSFTGHGIAVVAPRSPHRGSAQVYIDGVYIRTIFMWSRDDDRSTGRLHAAGSPAAAATASPLRVVGSGTHPLFRLDAFVVSK